MTSFLDPLLRADASSFALANDRHGRVVAGTLLTAFDSSSRRRGLLGRDFLPEDSALIIAPSNAIHTFFMRFAIDVAFVSRTGRVLKLRPGDAAPAHRRRVGWICRHRAASRRARAQRHAAWRHAPHYHELKGLVGARRMDVYSIAAW